MKLPIPSLSRPWQLSDSSRQLNNFEEAYSGHPHLGIHDLTARDIRLYVKATFASAGVLRRLMLEDPVTSKNIVQEILEKTEGVFLWYEYFARKIVPASAGRIIYHVQAAQIIHIIQLAKIRLSVQARYFTDGPDIVSMVLEGLAYTQYIARRHELTANGVKVRTPGLVELSSTVPEDVWAQSA
ncbi:uncharacterized protein RAG0_06234 [Rhynchosporium agropyri]|uniref:Uncharacterized protein n=1 Tax=Rhynchosporium agropyri TaxID=914238 RepID=A0A1E1KGC7_9HELO|nr:uncharacterized protein RAG0_06234 [Rhynchosporium agropyri]